jgi:hypothetical protein
VIAADVLDEDPHAAEVELEPVLEHDLGGSNAIVSGRRQLFLDVLGVLRRCMTSGDSRSKRLVAPIRRSQLG